MFYWFLKTASRHIFPIILAMGAIALLSIPHVLGASSGVQSPKSKIQNLVTQNSKLKTQNSTIGFGPNIRANQDQTTNGQHEPSLAVSRVHTNTVIVAAKDYRNGGNAKQVWIYGSTDGGQTWPVQLQMPGVPEELDRQSDPVVMARDDGRIYVACVAYLEGSPIIRAGVFITWTDDDGATWQNPSVPIFYPDNEVDDKDWFAIDNNPASPFYHRMYMMYAPGGGGNFVAEQHSTDGGLTWSARQQIAGSRYEYTYPVVASDGTVYNFMIYNWGWGFTGTIQYVKSTDGGVTWSNRTTIAIAEQPDSPIRPGDTFRFYAILSAAVDPNNGNLYVAWTDKRAIDTNGTDVLYVRSTDAGATWTEPARLSHDPPGVVRDHITPILTVGADSKLHAFWLDRRLDPNNRLFDSWYSSSTDGGLTWDPDMRVSIVSQDLNAGLPSESGGAAGDYWGLDTISDTVYVAWNDSRTGDQDILVSKGLMSSVEETATPSPTSSTPSATRTSTSTPTVTPAHCAGAYHALRPQPGSPSNGGTIRVGDRITFDMMISSGPHNVTAQQAYLTFSHDVLVNVKATETGCVLTATVARDSEVFEVDLQNEVCNGPLPCVFRRLVTQPGSMAYASGALNNPSYNGPDFRVAQIAFCAIAAGEATIHWQFAPPAPMTRDTEIVDEAGPLVSVRACYNDYTLTVLGPTRTPTGTATSTPTSTNTPACAPSFADVQQTDYFREPVHFLFCNGVISGYNDNTFRPTGTTTRAQVAKIVVLAKRWPFNTDRGPHFSDVPASAPLYTYIETLYNHGIVTGYDDGAFRPGKEVTRAQLAKIIVLAQGWEINTEGGPHYTDVPPNDAFYGYIETARNWSVISGYDDGAFRPVNNATRAQVAKIVYDALMALVR